MNKKGFTLIELMLVILIIGVLAGFAIPRYLKAIQKVKVSEARGVLKRIFQAASEYYEEFGQYPDTGFQFNDASTKETSKQWNHHPGLYIQAPSGYPRYSYIITVGNTTGFECTARSSNSWDVGLRDKSDIIINQQGSFIQDEYF